MTWRRDPSVRLSKVQLTGDDLVYSEAKEDEFLGWLRSEMIKPTTQAPPNS